MDRRKTSNKSQRSDSEKKGKHKLEFCGGRDLIDGTCERIEVGERLIYSETGGTPVSGESEPIESEPVT